MKNTVLFDLDGTLVNSLEDLKRCFSLHNEQIRLGTKKS